MRLENIIEFQKANYFYLVRKETDEAIGFEIKKLNQVSMQMLGLH